MKLRQQVFCIEQNCLYQDADDRDQDAWHLTVKTPEAELVAYARLMPKGISYQEYASIGRVITTVEYRGTGLGKILMEHAMKHCRNLFPGTSIKISAQSYLEGFYEDLQFKTVGDEYLEDGIPHIAMVLEPQID